MIGLIVALWTTGTFPFSSQPDPVVLDQRLGEVGAEQGEKVFEVECLVRNDGSQGDIGVGGVVRAGDDSQLQSVTVSIERGEERWIVVPVRDFGSVIPDGAAVNVECRAAPR